MTSLAMLVQIKDLVALVVETASALRISLAPSSVVVERDVEILTPLEKEMTFNMP